VNLNYFKSRKRIYDSIMSTHSINYRTDIDGLRALAVVPVILFHAGFSTFSGGFIGVDVFFIISGYLITGVIWREIVQKKFSLLVFYERRARRILPALFAMITATLVAGWFLLTIAPLQSLANSTFAAVFSISNVYFWRQTGYFAGASELFPLLHTWSLGVEEQFYIFVPLVLLLAARFGRNAMIATLTLIVVVSFCLSVWASHRYPSANFFLILTRAWELGIGGLLAVVRLPLPRPAAVRNCVGVIGVSMILAAVFLFDKNTVFPGLSALLPCFGTILLIWVGMSQPEGWQDAPSQGLVTRFLATRPMVSIGLISYSLYLWHWPVFVYLRHLTARTDLEWQWSFFGILLSTVLAVVSWRFVEQPFRNRTTIGQSTIAIFSTGGTVGLAAIALIISFSLKGAPFRIPEDVRQIADASEDFDSSCMNIISYCRIGSANLEPSFILMGDSHSAALRPALAVWAEQMGKSGYFQSFNSCPPVGGAMFGNNKGTSYSQCDQHARETLKFALSNPEIDTIVITAYWEAYLRRNDAVPQASTEGLFIHPNTNQSIDASQEIFFQGVMDVVRLLRDADKKVVIVHDLPDMPTNIPWVNSRKIMAGLTLETYFEFDNEISFNDRIEAMAVREGARSIRLSELICESGPDRCRILMGNISLYRDNNHLSKSGATDFVGPWLTERMEGL
jgi:peptidoglycan/LPS O-acetylase OafA/YrhL